MKISKHSQETISAMNKLYTLLPLTLISMINTRINYSSHSERRDLKQVILLGTILLNWLSQQGEEEQQQVLLTLTQLIGKNGISITRENSKHPT